MRFNEGLNTIDGEPCQTCGHGYAIHEFYNEMACEHRDWDTDIKCQCERFKPSPELAVKWERDNQQTLT